MAEIEANDFKRLGAEVHRFLGKTDLRTQLSTMAVLMLEFPDISTMHTVHKSIVHAMAPEMAMRVPDAESYRYIGDHTVEMELFGIRILLHCPQRLALESGRSIGFRDIKFIDQPE